MLEKLFNIIQRKLKRNTIAKNIIDENENFKFVSEKLIPLLKIQSDVIVTVTGIKHYFGNKPFEIGNEIRFIKEPSNKYDKRAIAAFCDGVGKCGYVANSEYTVKDGTLSSEVLYGGISEGCIGEILWIDEKFVLCSLKDVSFYSILLKYGIDFCFYEDFDSALKVFSAMEEKFPNAEVYRRISYCYIKKNDKENASVYAEKALKSDPLNPKTKMLFNEINN